MTSKIAKMFNNRITMPKKSALQCIGATVATVAILSWIRLRPLGLFFLAIFVFWLYKTRCNLRIVPPPELLKKYEQFVDRLIYWRKNRPTMLFLSLGIFFFLLALIGHVLSGTMLFAIFLTCAAVFVIMYEFQVERITPTNVLWLLNEGDHDEEAEVENEEFLPEVNDSNLVVLERASDLTSQTSPTEDADDDENSDEIPSDLLIPDIIPEVNEHSTDEEDDLVPIVQKQLEAPSCSDDAKSKRESLEFKKGHFKYDSSLSTSSSSEESLSKGLQFPDHTAVDGPAQRQIKSSEADDTNIIALAVNAQAQSVFAGSSKLLPNLMAGLVQWGINNAANNAGATAQTPDPSRRFVPSFDSSDESDYEILEETDFK